MASRSDELHNRPCLEQYVSASQSFLKGKELVLDWDAFLKGRVHATTLIRTSSTFDTKLTTSLIYNMLLPCSLSHFRSLYSLCTFGPCLSPCTLEMVFGLKAVSSQHNQLRPLGWAALSVRAGSLFRAYLVQLRPRDSKTMQNLCSEPTQPDAFARNGLLKPSCSEHTRLIFKRVSGLCCVHQQSEPNA